VEIYPPHDVWVNVHSSDRIAAYSGDLVGLYLGATAYEEAASLRSPEGKELSPGEIVEMVRDYLSSLPIDMFPNIRTTVEE
jgi:hypothetical protein